MSIDTNKNHVISMYSKTPNQYYWNQIYKSIEAITSLEEYRTGWINELKRNLSEIAQEKGVSVNSMEMNTELCYKACQAILQEVIYSCGKPPYIGYALEYFHYAPTIFDLGSNTRERNDDSNSYYNLLLENLYETLTTEVNSKILCKTSSDTSCNVIDLDLLRSELKKTVNQFYMNNSELKESTNRIPRLQYKIDRVFSEMSLSLNKKAGIKDESKYGF